MSTFRIPDEVNHQRRSFLGNAVSYVDVAPLLASAGYRVIVPYLRGYGTTRFLSSETFRNGQQSEHDFNKDIWQLASPKWDFDDATYNRSAASFREGDSPRLLHQRERPGQQDRSLRHPIQQELQTLHLDCHSRFDSAKA